MDVLPFPRPTHTHAHMYTDKHTHTHKHAHKCTHTCKHTKTHKYTHTQTWDEVITVKETGRRQYSMLSTCRGQQRSEIYYKNCLNHNFKNVNTVTDVIQ